MYSKLNKISSALQPEQVQFTYPLILPLQEAHRTEYKDPKEYKYGPHARHNLDVYRPEALAESKTKYPVLMFAYGGGFMQGDKRASTGGPSIFESA